MIRRCWMAVLPNGDTAVFLTQTRAVEYASQHHGYIVNMTGVDHAGEPPEDEND